MRRPLVVGNWKMNGCYAENKVRLDTMRRQLEQYSKVQTAVCPPFVYLSEVIRLLAGSQINCGSQNVSEHADGAFTGEISTAMLTDIGCTLAIVGHSERRQYHHETNQQIAEKAVAALKADLTPIICVGESQQQREAEETLAVIDRQLAAVTKVLNQKEITKTVIAYEPIWAIGTGLTATPDQAQAVHAFIRRQLAKEIGNAAEEIRLLYGGSVKPDNAAELFSQEDIDGALVGGASLIADDFIAIVKAADVV